MVQLRAGHPHDPSARRAHPILPFLLVAIQLTAGVELTGARQPRAAHAEVRAPADAAVLDQERQPGPVARGPRAVVAEDARQLGTQPGRVLRPGYGEGNRQLRPASVVVATRAP